MADVALAPRAQGRIVVLAAASALGGAIPLPFVPRRIRIAVRGAIAHDLAAQHGLSISADARHALAAAEAEGESNGPMRRALGFIAGRALARVGVAAPLMMALGPARAAYETLAFGRLFEHYLRAHRRRSAHAEHRRIEADEARRVRRLIDRAALRVAMPGLSATREGYEAPEELRDPVERAVDGVLIGLARLPEAAGARLDAALDEVFASATEAERP
jgi:hypothetical protein